MDNQNNNSLSPENQEWLDNLLSDPTRRPEIEADEHAVHAAGLTHPNDLELEKILSENWDEVEDVTTLEAEPTPEDAPTIIMESVPVIESVAEDITETEEADPTIEAQPVEADVIDLQEQPAEQTDAPEIILPPEPVAETVPEPEEVPPSTEEAVNEAPKEEPARPVEKKINYRKRQWRRRLKRGYGFFGIPHLVSTAIWLALILFIGVSLGRTLWVSCADLMAFGKENRKVTIKISEEEKNDIGLIADKLSRANLIRYPGLFKTFAEATGKAENISDGEFTLNSQLDYNAMINAMSYHSEAREVVEIMFPEGYNCAQIFRLLEKEKVCTVAELEECVKNATANNPGKQDVLKTDYWFLEGIEWGDKYALEGYLFPDTYKFYTNDDPERVLEKFLNNFDSRFTDKMMTDYIKLKDRMGLDLSLRDIVSLASIIQKETSSVSESYDISSVFYNRLIRGDVLGSDATVYYAIGDYFGNKETLTSIDLAVNSPYNTRTHGGVPPGPICSPGRDSLYAALYPNETSYYFFVFDKDRGVHVFAKTEAEHEQNCRELGLW